MNDWISIIKARPEYEVKVLVIYQAYNMFVIDDIPLLKPMIGIGEYLSQDKWGYTFKILMAETVKLRYGKPFHTCDDLRCVSHWQPLPKILNIKCLYNFNKKVK